jgi:hypothetical protein
MSLEAAQIGMLRQAYTAIGATFPNAVKEAIADRDKLNNLDALTVATSDQVADAILDCLLDGRDPLNDTQVQRLTTSYQLGGATGGNLSYVVGRAAERRVIAAYQASGDEILATLTEAAAVAGKNLADAHRILGDIDLSDSDTIMKLGPDAARAWAEARDAEKLLRQIDRAWSALATLTGFASVSGDPTLRLAALDLEQYEKVGRKADAWTIVRAGATIALADAASIRERTDAIHGQRQKRQGIADNAAEREQGRAHRFTAA